MVLTALRTRRVSRNGIRHVPSVRVDYAEIAGAVSPADEGSDVDKLAQRHNFLYIDQGYLE